MVHVGLEWSHGMALTTLDAQMWLRGEVPGLGLTDEDVGLLRGWIVISWLWWMVISWPKA
jgi:hypothetical protein